MDRRIITADTKIIMCAIEKRIAPKARRRNEIPNSGESTMPMVPKYVFQIST